MKQDKELGVVIMDKLKYHEKCLMILGNENFIKLDRNPTNKTEEKIQRILRKMKNKKITTRVLIFISKWILSRQVLWNS